MTTEQPSPASLARAAEAGRVVPGDGPVGDVVLDDALARLRASADAFVRTAPGPQTQGEPDETSAVLDEASAAPELDEAGSPDAADVIARAHDAHEALQRRLGEAQA